MPTTAGSYAESPERSAADGPLPLVFEAIAAVVIALAGLASILAGSALHFGIDRATVSRAIENGVSVATIERATLTPTETVDLLDTVVTWTGTGLLVVGLAMLAFAGAYIGLRYRTRRGATSRVEVSDFTAYAVVGSAAAAVLSFLPGSAGLGGVAAGYFEAGDSRRSASVGALSGLLLTIPALLVAVFALGGLSAGLLAIGFTDSAALVVVGAGVVVLFVVAVNVGLGALGGYAGGLLGGD
jgi:hypothetical protein